MFDKRFIFDLYSSRKEKGTHRGVERLAALTRKLSSNYNRPLYALKCDIRKFFDSVDHAILMDIVAKVVLDEDTRWLIHKIVKSFQSARGIGIPLGNVTSQLFANIYLNELDQHITWQCGMKHYLRYCDDFIILSKNKEQIVSAISHVRNFLMQRLKLELHPHKVTVRKLSQGIDFLGYVCLPHHRILRRTTKNRILRKIAALKSQRERGEITQEFFNQSVASYLGVIEHCKGYKIQTQIETIAGTYFKL